MTGHIMKPMLRLVLLPSLLLVSLLLSACDDNSFINDAGVEEDASGIMDKDTKNVPTADLSAEEQMIHNLARYRWTLRSATNSNGQPLKELMDIKDQVILSFNQYQGQNSISYSVGCNMANATYELQGNALTTETAMSTKMLCDDLNKAENNLNELMEGESQLSLTEENTSAILTQNTADATLVWIGRLTAQAKYNSKGETVFWAVRAPTQLCVEDSTQACLQVKTVNYDDQGLKTSEGEWTEFSGNIDGYQHDEAHDEVLRLQRYKLNTSDASNASDEEYAYVLDTVIESEVVS